MYCYKIDIHEYFKAIYCYVIEIHEYFKAIYCYKIEIYEYLKQFIAINYLILLKVIKHIVLHQLIKGTVSVICK